MVRRKRYPWWRWLKSPWLWRAFCLIWVVFAATSIHWCWEKYTAINPEGLNVESTEEVVGDLPLTEDGTLRAFRKIPKEKVQFASYAVYFMMALILVGFGLMLALIILFWEPPTTAVQIASRSNPKRGKNYRPYAKPSKASFSTTESERESLEEENSVDDTVVDYLKKRRESLPPIPLEEDENSRGL